MMAARAHGMDIVGRWAVQRDVSPIDDSPTFTALNYLLEAEAAGKRPNTPIPMLMLKCVDEERVVVIALGERIRGKNNWVDVVYRVDSATAQKTSWPMTPDQRHALLTSRERIKPFIHEISGGEKLFVQLTDAAGKNYRYNFRLAGLKDLEQELVDACDWLPPEEAAARKAAELARFRDPKRVKMAQRALKKFGMYAGEIDGDATNKRYRPGVMMYQIQFGLKLTGEADDKTFNHMMR